VTVAVRGGTVVTAQESRRADVFVNDGRIVRVGRVPTADREIDATGLLVLPGCVDLHTHLASTPAWTPLDGFATGSRAAIAGGVTTVVSMVYQEDGSLRRGIERAVRDAEVSACDFAFHSVVTDPTDAVLAELPGLVDDGFAGLKVFMVTPRFVEKTAEYLDLYRAAARLGMTVAVHAEDRMLIERSTAALHLAGKTAVQYFPASRPVEAEVVAVRAALKNAAATRVATYLVHISSGAALEEIRRAKAAFESRVTAETRPLYLYLTRERFDRPDAALWVGQPPLREQADVYAVWRALADGTLDTVGTDHIPRNRADKLAPGLTFDKIPPGVANLETLLPMLYSEGVRKERLSIERLVDVLATRPARIAGMTTKGEIAAGMDADLVLFDPAKTRTIRAKEMHSACDYDPYDGWEVTGWPRTVLLRGEIAYDRGEIRAAAGAGRLVRRSAAS
jgi:dihydropyrimidinase